MDKTWSPFKTKGYRTLEPSVQFPLLHPHPSNYEETRICMGSQGFGVYPGPCVRAYGVDDDRYVEILVPLSYLRLYKDRQREYSLDRSAQWLWVLIPHNLQAEAFSAFLEHEFDWGEKEPENYHVSGELLDAVTVRRRPEWGSGAARVSHGEPPAGFTIATIHVPGFRHNVVGSRRRVDAQWRC